MKNFSNLLFGAASFVALWLAVNYVIGFISGWSELARAYRFGQRFHGQHWNCQSGRMRLMMGFHNCLTVGANSDGLYLAVSFLFRPGMQPVLIPWNDVCATPGKLLFWKYVLFQFRQAPSVYLKLPASLSEKVRAAAGVHWPGDRGGAVRPF